MTSESSDYGSPWYQNFWPWFIVVLLGISVVASLFTVGLAFQHRDVDVRSIAPVEPSTQPLPATPQARDRRASGS
jgi:hypothetical protein